MIVLSEKVEALLFLDLSNILCIAKELDVWIDFRKLLLNLSQTFHFKGLFAFTSLNLNNGLIEALYNMGFSVYSNPYDSDALMGFLIAELMRIYDVEAVIIGTHDGDFRGICDRLEQINTQVYILGFRDKFSTFLKCKNCLYLDDFTISKLPPLRSPRR